MGLKNNLLAFGVSVTAIAGGGVGLVEALHYKDKHQEQIACLSEKYAGTTACKDMVVTPEITSATHDTQEIYSWIAGIGLVGGALGLMGVYARAIVEEEFRHQTAKAEA